MDRCQKNHLGVSCSSKVPGSSLTDNTFSVSDPNLDIILTFVRNQNFENPKTKPLLTNQNNLVSRSTTTDDVFILSEKNETLMPIGPSGRIYRRPSDV